MISELRGHMGEGRAGREKTGASAERREAERRKVGKLPETVARKAAIVYHKPVPQTDTGR